MREVEIAEARKLAEEGRILLLDVREPHETVSGMMEGAVSVPLSEFDERIASAAPDKSRAVLLYCAGGVRSEVAARTMDGLGYSNTLNMVGGIEKWKALGNKCVVPGEQPESQADERYSRQTVLREIGTDGQRTLANSTVLLLGAGGTGSSAALYLAAAGVGHMRIVDPDDVELSNLTRQILHTTERIGTSKTDSAEIAIHALNPEVEVTNVHLFADSANLPQLLEGVDVVIDATDNAKSREAVNAACVAARIPVVFGSAVRFEGTVMAYVPGGPCYRCAHPDGSADAGESCEQVGVISALPGAIGSLQATEAMKILLHLGRPLAGRIVVYEALETQFHAFDVDRDPNCPVCS